DLCAQPGRPFNKSQNAFKQSFEQQGRFYGKRRSHPLCLAT
ncbi:3760_t:CDS:1, partial [Funneliformis caledonium]